MTGAMFGLYIGIDRYESPLIDTLASASRDAQALNALFADNIDGHHNLLVNDEATTGRIRAELTALQLATSPDDFVVISFSGHGSDTNEIVTYDTDRDDIPNTGLPMDEFTQLVSAIQARNLLIVLDCCFSGAAGSKVLNSTRVPRGAAHGLPRSTEAFLRDISGTGRVILTASTADQEAFEDPRLGHGYLTWYLLQALLGSADTSDDDTVDLYALLQFVTEKVSASASAQHRARQDPTLRGQWNGRVNWPVFRPGPRYVAMFPATYSAPVTADIGSLADHGIPVEFLDRWRERFTTLNTLQREAANCGLLEQRNLVVTAPTSSGKTLIGEMAAIRATQNGGRSVFLLPTKALVNEQYDRFSRTYRDLGVRVLRASGDHHDDVPSLLRGQFDLAVFTYERFTGLALSHPHLLRLISVVVVDEVQNIIDKSRGPNLELLLTLVRSRADEGVAPQIVALSAVLGKLNGLDSWLDAHLLHSVERPVPLDEGVLTPDGVYRYLDPSGNERNEQLIDGVYGASRAADLLVPLVRRLTAAGQQVIVVRGERGAATGAAGYLAQTLGLTSADAAIAKLPDNDLTPASRRLRYTLAGGVAFHSTDLGPEERRVVEDHYRQPHSEIRVIVSTTTLAQGVNLPAETVVLAEVSRRIGAGHVGWFTTAEYKNIVGRAGRLGLTQRGRAITLSWDATTSSRLWTGYVTAEPENVASALLDTNVDIETLVLRTVGIASGRTTDRTVATSDVTAILSNSLAAHQARLTGREEAFDPSLIASTITELEHAGLLDPSSGNRTTPTSLGKLVADSVLTVRSAVRVARTLRAMNADQLNRTTLLSLAQLTTELDATRINVNKRGARKEWSTFSSLLQANAVAPSVIYEMQRTNAAEVAAARAKKAAACLFWTAGSPIDGISRHLMQHHPSNDASAAIRQVVARTQDVIVTVATIASEVHPTVDIADTIRLLPAQLELGVNSRAAALAAAGAELYRNDYAALAEADLLDPDTILNAAADTLMQVLRGNSARVRTLQAAATELRNQVPTPSASELLGPNDPNA